MHVIFFVSLECMSRISLSYNQQNVATENIVNTITILKQLNQAVLNY